MSTVDRWRSLLAAASDASGFTVQQLDAAVGFVVEVVPGAVACSITELDGGTYRTSVASCALAIELDLAQYASGDGPCMTAARDRQMQQVPDTAASTRFVPFASAAAQRGVRSSLSLPILTAFHPAALNIYAHDVEAFDRRGRAVATFLARALTACLSGRSQTPPMSASESAQVARQRALIVTAQEVGVGGGATPHEAFNSMVRRSSQERRSIFDVAAEIAERDAAT